MQKEVEGIDDRIRNIQTLLEQGLLWLNERPAQPEREPRERDTDNIEDLLANLLHDEDERSRRRENQCTE